MKTPKFLSKLSAVLTPRPRKKLQATARALPRASMEDYENEEPTTKLSSAFIVVFILHVVAIAGIYAFTCIKESRASQQAALPAAPTTVAEKPKVTTPVEPKLPAQSPAVINHNQDLASLAPVPVVANVKPGQQKYVVKAGDNPTKIAIAYGLKADELLAANNLKPGAVLQQGQTLVIPAPKPAPKATPAITETNKPEPQKDVPPTKTTPGLRIVKKGDTAISIAKTYGITATELLKYNKIADATKLQLGQALKIPPKKG
jgi:LysM repeat protein